MKRAKEILRRGFTLIELLVSMVILSIMLLALGQAMGFVANLWLSGIGTVDNYTKARNVLSIIDRDVQTMVMRPDVAAFVDSTGSNPACAFYTNVQGYSSSVATDNRAVSLVQYVLNPPNLSPAPSNAAVTQTTLGRLNYGMTFPATTGTSVASNTMSIGNSTALINLVPASAPTDAVASGMILFQWQFVDGAGNILTPLSSDSTLITSGGTTSPYSYKYSFNYGTPGLSSNPHAVVVSIMVLSNSAYTLALNTGQIPAIMKLFPVGGLPANPNMTSNASETYSQYWNSILNPVGTTFGPSLPPAIRAGLKVFQRYIPLPAPPQ